MGVGNDGSYIFVCLGAMLLVYSTCSIECFLQILKSELTLKFCSYDI